MADETISTRIVANADFSALIADVHKVTASLSRLQEQLANSNKMLANNVAVMNRNFADTLRSTGQFSTHFVSLTSDVEKFGKNLDGGRLKLRDYFNTYQNHIRTSGGLIRDLARQQVAMQNAVLQPLGRNAEGLMQFNVHVPRGLDAVKNKTAIARQELQIMNKVIQDGSVQLINWGKNTQWAGRQLTVGLSLPLAAFGKAAADAFKVADQELTRLTKVYGDIAGTSRDELSRVRQDVIATSKELSSAYGTNFAETISLAADIAATGKTGNELLSSVKETSRLAVLGEVDRQEAMKATLAIQSAFKQNTTELADSINFLNAVENQTSTTLNDLVEAIPKAGPVIKGLGGSIQDLALYLTAMREGGINASEGANALKSALASLINPTDVAVGKFQSFGIDLMGIVNNNAGNVTQTLLDLQSALDRLNPLQKQQAIEQLFGKFQFSRLNALFENLGRQGSQTLKVLDLMKASSADLAAVAGRELTAVTESASGKYKRAIESLKADLAGLGDQFLSIATNIVNIVDKALEFFNNLPRPIKQALTFLGALTAVAGPLIMLTGVLANFFGYILKGVMHMKAFFKGGEGWKYLTPEMLAAEKAGKLVEQSFYADAKAASILQLALKNLIDEFSILEAKARSGAVAVNPAVSTMAGNLVMAAGGERIVDPNHPLVGPMGTRASTHMVARATLTEQQRLQQTMFGLVPGSMRVNEKIGEAPQIYMSEKLPNVPGLTTIGGVSTGVVSSEAAKWHAMTATLGMQSKAELDALKKQMIATGVLSKDFMNQFDDMLPIISNITDNAAAQSAGIVAELRAGKITVDAAKARIIALNLEIEQMIASAAVGQATSMGRTLNPTMVPTLDQPVVGPTGQSNMRELFKKSKTRDFVNRVAGALGVRTSGAGYNIETTRPRKLQMGEVGIEKYAGGYVSIKAATAAAKMLRKFANRSKMIGGLKTTEKRSPRVGAEQGAGISYGELYKRGSSVYNEDLARYGITPTVKGVGKDDEYLVHGMVPGFLKRTKSLEGKGSSAVIKQSQYEDYGLNISSGVAARGSLQVVPTQFIKNTKGFNEALRDGVASAADFRPVSGKDMVSLLLFLKDEGVPPANAMQIANRAASVLNQKVSSYQGPITEQVFGKLLNNASVRAIASGFRPSMVQRTNPFGTDKHSRNLGLSPAPFKDGVEQLSGYGGGDIIPALLEPGESVVTKSATKGNAGALTLMNAGYNLDGVLGLQEGIVSAFTSGVKNPYGKSMISGGIPGAGKPMGFGTQMAIGMGGMMAGNAIGGPAGMAVMMASNFLPLMTGLKGLGGVIPIVTKLASVLGKLTIPGAVITSAFLLGKYLLNLKKNAEEAGKANRQAFGMSADVIKKAGYSITDFNANVKQSIEDMKALQERNKMLYESMFQANIPIKMTIAEYKKLRAEVKEGMPDLIKLFNQKGNAEVGSVASSLKAQFMALGDNVDTATAKVYALISQSNKAQFAAAAIGSKGFAAIKDSADAAIKSADNFDKAMSMGDAKAASDALIVTFEGIGQAIEDNAKKNKLEFGDSMDQVLKKMVASGKGQILINKDILNELKKQNPELASIINSTDTATSAWAKYQLALKGVNIDLVNISGAAAEAALKLESIVSRQVVTTLKGTNGIKQQYAAYNSLQTQIKNAQKAAAGQSAKSQIDSRKEVESLNKQIAKIKEKAEAKIKALRRETQTENDNLEIQKLQLEYQQAMARGDQDAAAQAQIALKQFTGQVQLRKAEESIQDKADIEIKPLQDKLDALAKKNQDLADKAALAGDSLSKLQERAESLGAKLREVESATTATAIGDITKGTNRPERDAELARQNAAMTALGLPSSVVNRGPNAPKTVRGQVVPPSYFSAEKGSVNDITSTIVSQLQSGINAKDVVIYADTIKEGRTGGYSKNNPASIGFDKSYNTRSDRSTLDDQSKYKIVLQNKLKSGDYFTYDGKTYQVKTANWTQYGLGSVNVVAQKSDGGSVKAGDLYRVNETNMEFFRPNVNGSILPSGSAYALGASYNISPSAPNVAVNGRSNNSSTNNVYNIDIDLNGTNVTADDIMRRFKAELSLINAKEGRVRTVGGSY